MTAPSAAHHPIRAVVFDLDGTLVDSLPFCVSAIARACGEALGRPIRESEVRARFGPSESGVIRSLVGPEAHATAYRRFWEIYRADHPRRVATFAGVPALLRGLRERGLRLAVVTGKGEETARWTLGATGIGSVAGPVWAGSLDGGFKRENLGRAAAQLGVEPREMAYVGDQPSDMAIAREASVRPVGAGWAPGADRAGLALDGAEVVLRSPPELARWVDGQADRPPRAPHPGRWSAGDRVEPKGGGQG
ncbi:phosphoglycolate phosphatase [mine drainage metagenome]|uniref:Phosphoglycolate phosphatase n=1 Tax=mine drainage metagenome TaxID=410659 RepID=T1BP03_9ZZZZ